MIFSQQIEQQPQAVALDDGSRQRSWKELEQQALKWKTLFVEDYGLEPGDHIATLTGNRSEFFEVLLASISSGLWITPINNHLSTSEILYILEDSSARLLVLDPEHQHIGTATLPCPHIDIEKQSESLLTQSAVTNTLTDSSVAGGTMIYTSGTTGKPKGVKRSKPDTLGETLTRMQASGALLGLEGKGPHLITGPLYHAAPMLFAFYDMLNGAPVIIMPRWNTEHFLELVERHKVYSTHLVPTMFIRLLKLQSEQAINATKLKSLRLVLHGAAPITTSVKKQMIEWWGPILLEYWGASESGVCTLITSEEWLAHPGSVGKPLPHLDIFIGDEQGNPNDAESGLLFCRNEQINQVFEYHRAPEKTRSAHPKPGTFCIGDMGRMNAEGYIYLDGRQSNMIISGGVNIYPAEIEHVLMEHPAIADLVVYGVPDPEWGEKVKAMVELQNNYSPDEELEADIQNFARKHLAGYKIPRLYYFTDQLPRNAAGKVPKSELV